MNDRGGDFLFFMIGVVAVAAGILAYTCFSADGGKQPTNAPGTAREFNMDRNNSGANGSAD